MPTLLETATIGYRIHLSTRTDASKIKYTHVLLVYQLQVPLPTTASSFASSLPTSFFTALHSSALAPSNPPSSLPTSKIVTTPSRPPTAIFFPSLPSQAIRLRLFDSKLAPFLGVGVDLVIGTSVSRVTS